MKRMLLSLLTASSLLFHSTPTNGSAHRTLHAIAPLSILGGQIICTVWSVNEEKHYWVTAGHCIEADEHYFIEGEAATPVDVNHDLDIAVLHTADGAPALPISDTQPEIGDGVATFGFPLHNAKPVASWGQVMSNDMEVPIPTCPFPFCPDEVHHYIAFTMTALPGHSGSPVLHHGHVVSVVQIGGGGGFSGGLPWRMFVTFLRPYR
jgi:hypothetical protein